MIFAAPAGVDHSGCRNNDAQVTLNGEALTVTRGETLTVGGEELRYIANGDVTVDGVTYASNIDEVIAVYGSAVPASFLQNCVILLINE